MTSSAFPARSRFLAAAVLVSAGVHAGALRLALAIDRVDERAAPEIAVTASSPIEVGVRVVSTGAAPIAGAKEAVRASPPRRRIAERPRSSLVTVARRALETPAAVEQSAGEGGQLLFDSAPPSQADGESDGTPREGSPGGVLDASPGAGGGGLREGEGTPGLPLAAADGPKDPTPEIVRRLSIAAEGCYPPAAARFRAEGETRVRFCIDAEGQPQGARVLSSSGFEILDDAALNCVLPRAAPLPRTGPCLALPVRFSIQR
jgi:protein TonB